MDSSRSLDSDLVVIMAAMVRSCAVRCWPIGAAGHGCWSGRIAGLMRVGCVRLGTQEKQTTIDFKYDADDDDDDGNDVCEDLHWRCQSETSSSSSFSSLSVRPSVFHHQPPPTSSDLSGSH